MARDNVTYRIVPTAMGEAALAGGPAGLKAVLLPGAGRREMKSELDRRYPGAEERPRDHGAAARAIERYFRTGRLAAAGIRLDLTGVGPFRAAVYGELARIPAGETVTYAELARRIGRPGAHRSVGTALSRNPLPLFLPCHRVRRTDGGLGGFTAEGGIALKRAMLRLEGVDA